MSGPFCIDCKHYVPANHGRAEICTAKVWHSMVTGSPAYRYCWVMRDHAHLCGHEARLFEKAPPPVLLPAPLPWWRRVFA